MRRLRMGPVSYTHLKESMGGFVSNPMDKPEASKVSLFGLADYSWHIHGFKSDEAWKEGVRRLFPKAAEAMQVFVNHNSDQGPHGHGYRREESVAIEPVDVYKRQCHQWGSLGPWAQQSPSCSWSWSAVSSSTGTSGTAVSYTHLDVYKRQGRNGPHDY